MRRHVRSARPRTTATTPSSSASRTIPDKRARKPQLRPLQEGRPRPEALPARGAAGRAGHARPSATLVTADVFKVGDLVDVIGTTKGRGFAGTIKRHGFHRGPETHGCMNVRAARLDRQQAHRQGAQGQAHGRPLRASSASTTKNLSVVRVDADAQPALHRAAPCRARRRLRPGAERAHDAAAARQGERRLHAGQELQGREARLGVRRTSTPRPSASKVLYRTLKDAVVMYQANQRQGTAKTKGAPRSRAPARSPGSRSTPAARARATASRRSGAAAARSSGRSRATTSTTCRPRRGAWRCARRCAASSQDGEVVRRRPAALRRALGQGRARKCWPTSARRAARWS